MAQKQYTGSCYVGVVGSEIEIGECHDSVYTIVMRPGDEGPNWIRATKGYEARQKHLNNFIASNHSFCLLLDADMVFSADTLERLRAHKLPFITGFYLRRRYAPVAPVWFWPPKGTTLPLEPYIQEPERGKLHELGASGWGCMLIHREVIENTRPLLKGEPEIIEDDMDIWPYDLGAIMGAIRGLRNLSSLKPPPDIVYPALTEHVSTLERELRPLRGMKWEVVGSDIRYPFYARQAGYKLYGDPDVRPAHMLNYPLVPDDFTAGVPDAEKAKIKEATLKGLLPERKQIRARLAELRGEK